MAKLGTGLDSAKNGMPSTMPYGRPGRSIARTLVTTVACPAMLTDMRGAVAAVDEEVVPDAVWTLAWWRCDVIPCGRGVIAVFQMLRGGPVSASAMVGVVVGVDAVYVSRLSLASVA